MNYPVGLHRKNTLRIVAAITPGLLLALILLTMLEPIPQPLSYHDFADERVIFGIPHAGDALTNIGFLIVSALGLWFLAQPEHSAQSFIDSRERLLFQVFFTGVFFTAIGSGWYHLQPDNYSLFWDRIPMAVCFMSLFAIMIGERIKLSLGIVLLWPLVILGISSVVWWIWSEHIGQGDLRWYLIVQFYPLLTIALMLLLLPTPYTRGNDYWGIFIFYALAKIVEIYDYEILSLSAGLISGHNLKHLLAQAGIAWLLRMLWLRQAQQEISTGKNTHSAEPGN